MTIPVLILKPGKLGDLNFICPGPEIGWNVSQKVRKHGHETQLMITLQDLMSHRNNTQIDMAILDFSKAFDTVPYDSLLGKLQFYGIDGHILKWISIFP